MTADQYEAALDRLSQKLDRLVDAMEKMAGNNSPTQCDENFTGYRYFQDKERFIWKGPHEHNGNAYWLRFEGWDGDGIMTWVRRARTLPPFMRQLFKVHLDEDLIGHVVDVPFTDEPELE